MLQRLLSSVQPTDAWRELWVFRKSGAKWTIIPALAGSIVAAANP